MSRQSSGSARSAPPLRPFGLILHRDGRWTHEGQPIRNRKLRERFDRSVVYLPIEDAYVVQIAHFRGQIEIEETGFFVRWVDLASGELMLSDGSREPLNIKRLSLSALDGALIASVKAELRPGGLPARFFHGPQAELLGAAELSPDGRAMIRVAGEWQLIPSALLESEGSD